VTKNLYVRSMSLTPAGDSPVSSSWPHQRKTNLKSTKQEPPHYAVFENILRTSSS
jgi:hypothetical protein